MLLSWITTKQESAGWFTRVQGRPSAITAFNRHPDYLRQNPSWSAVIEAVDYDTAIPPGVDIWNQLMQFSNQLLGRSVPPDQGFRSAQLVLQQMLDDYWASVNR
ncbi:MAG: hypothetical protein ACOX4G_00150 [Limnochordia bacterium]